MSNKQSFFGDWTIRKNKNQIIALKENDVVVISKEGLSSGRLSNGIYVMHSAPLYLVEELMKYWKQRNEKSSTFSKEKQK